MPQKNKKRRTAVKTTPVREMFLPSSFIHPLIKNGIEGIAPVHRGYLDLAIRTHFSDSLALDDAMLKDHEQENRWDYLLGHKATSSVIALEPHSAKQDQISTVIAKRRSAKDQIQPYLKPGKAVRTWLWVASGEVHFADTEKVRLQLDQSGIKFVGRKVLAKHLA